MKQLGLYLPMLVQASCHLLEVFIASHQESTPLRIRSKRMHNEWVL